MEGNPRLDDILGLTMESLFARRLQTIVYLKGFANTPKQARQFITHGHISISGKKVTIPSYIVKAGEERNVNYNATSPINNELHPERPNMEKFEERMKEFRGENKKPDEFDQRRGGKRGGRFTRGGGSKPKGGKGQPQQGNRGRGRR